jgi:integrase
MGVRIRARNGREYVVGYYVHAGRKCEHGLGFVDEGITRERAEEMLEALRPGQPVRGVSDLLKVATKQALESMNPTPEMTFSEAFELWHNHSSNFKTTWRDDRGRFHTHLADTIGSLPLSQIKVVTLEDLLATLRAKKLSNASQVRILAVVSSTFNHVIRRELWEGTNPVSRIKKPRENNQRLRVFTHEEVELILDTCDDPDVHDIFLLSVHSGLRLSECLHLEFTDLSFERESITVRDTKNGTTHTTFMHPRVKAMLMRRVGERAGNEQVFRFKSPTTVTHKFAEVVKQLGLNDGVKDERYRACFHTARHTFATNVAMKGASLPTLMALMNHKTPALSLRYTKLGDEHLKAAVAAL